MRAILYERVSTAEQKKGFSLHAQHHELKLYCERQRYQVVRAFRETGSRRDMSREALVRLLELADRRVYDVVVVWRRDRFGAGRDVKDIEDFLKARGVRVEAMMMGPQADTSVTKFVNGMMDLVADLEVDTTQERCMGGKLQAARMGKWPHKPPPGWTRTYPDKAIVIDDEAARRIRGLFQAVADGKTIREAAHLYHGGDHVTALARIHNPAYKGDAAWCGIEVKLPAIVSAALWEAAQRALDLKKRNRNDGGRGPLPSGSPPPVPAATPRGHSLATQPIWPSS